MILGIIMWIVGFNNIPNSDYDVTIKETFEPAFFTIIGGPYFYQVFYYLEFILLCQ